MITSNDTMINMVGVLATRTRLGQAFHVGMRHFQSCGFSDQLITWNAHAVSAHVQVNCEQLVVKPTQHVPCYRIFGMFKQNSTTVFQLFIHQLATKHDKHSCHEFTCLTIGRGHLIFIQVEPSSCPCAWGAANK